MASKKPSSGRGGPANARQAKIQAAQKTSGGGANKIVIATVVAILAIVGTIGGVIWKQQAETDKITAGGKAVPVGSAMGQGFRAYADVTPVAGAPKVDLYEDFQCPGCRSFEEILGPTVEEQAKAGKVELTYHVKNFLDDRYTGAHSTRAAIGTFCASDAGKFQEFHDAVFANQPAVEGEGWTDAQLKGFAEDSGITGTALTTWESCLKAQKYANYVNSVEEASNKDGIQGTPSMRINGKDINITEEASSSELLTALFDAARS